MKTTITNFLIVIGISITLNVLAAEGGGNGPGNGTGELASQLALKSLLSVNDGRSVEEKIYDLWLRAENSVPSNFERSRVWFGLNVENIGEETWWTLDRTTTKYDRKSKYQKVALQLEQIPAVMVGEIEVRPAQVFGQHFYTGNYDGNLNPRSHFAGTINPNGGSREYGNLAYPQLRYEGRPDLGKVSNSSELYSIKAVSFLPSGMLVKSTLYADTFPPTEYRQIDENTLVGVRKAVKTNVGFYCPETKSVFRKEKQIQKSTKYLLGIPYAVDEEVEVNVLDHYELAKDYGVPGVCEVHYLMKTKEIFLDR